MRLRGRRYSQLRISNWGWDASRIMSQVSLFFAYLLVELFFWFVISLALTRRLREAILYTIVGVAVMTMVNFLLFGITK